MVGETKEAFPNLSLVVELAVMCMAAVAGCWLLAAGIWVDTMHDGT